MFQGMEDVPHGVSPQFLPYNGPSRPAEWGASRPHYSGPIPGQTVMHPRDLGKQAYGITGEEEDRGIIDPTEAPLEADKYGMVQQRHDPLAAYETPREAFDNDPDLSSPLLYSSHGGGIKTPENLEHWERQPLVHIRTDTPLHSTQSAEDTEYLGDLKGIRRDLETGGKINNPAWVVKDKGKLFVLDGHHRIAASRLEGRSQFPARLWNRDAGG